VNACDKWLQGKRNRLAALLNPLPQAESWLPDHRTGLRRAKLLVILRNGIL
jgi:hypothetical protein